MINFNNMFKILLSITITFGLVNLIFAQADSNDHPLKISGYLETYYVYDFGEPVDHNRPDFLYSFNRHNEVSLNFGYIQAAYDDDQVRGTLALMTGTYANANLAAEPGVLKNIFEANAGVKISKTKNLWVDAGIFGSHIGFETNIANQWIFVDIGSGQVLKNRTLPAEELSQRARALVEQRITPKRVRLLR